MKKLFLTISLITSFLAHAEMWESPRYKTYVISANDNIFAGDKNADIYFRFAGEGEYGMCATGVRYKEKLVLLQDGTNEREYILRAYTEETGNSGECKPGEPILAVAYVKNIVSKWYRLKGGQSAVITVPENITIQIR